MAKKIYLSPSSQPGNTYATGNTNEQVQCRKIAEACAVLLKKAGFEVRVGNSGTMQTRVADSNGFGADLHVAIHTNAFDGKITGGTQIHLFKLDGEHKKVGQAVLDRLAPLTPGTSHEKLVKNTSFYEIKNARAITVYCECEFHDTKTGSDFIRSHTTEIGEAIALGICDYYGVHLIADEPAKPEKLYRVQVGAYSKYENAVEMQRKLKSAGFDAIIR